MENQLDLFEIIGDVSSYEAVEVVEPIRKEMIGNFKGKIVKAEMKTGTSAAGRNWANVNLRIECLDDGLEGRLAFIGLFLGKEPSLYGDQDKSQTQVFLDTLKTAGLEFADKTPQGFEASVASLVGQECSYKSWHQKKKNKSTGKMELQFNESDYKVLAQKLIKPEGEVVNTASEVWDDV